MSKKIMKEHMCDGGRLSLHHTRDFLLYIIRSQYARWLLHIRYDFRQTHLTYTCIGLKSYRPSTLTGYYSWISVRHTAGAK